MKSEHTSLHHSLSSSFCLMDHFPVDSLLGEKNVTTLPALLYRASAPGSSAVAGCGKPQDSLRTHQTYTASRCVAVRRTVVLKVVGVFVLLLLRSSREFNFFPHMESHMLLFVQCSEFYVTKCCAAECVQKTQREAKCRAANLTCSVCYFSIKQ